MNRWTLWFCFVAFACAPGCAYLRAPSDSGPRAETFRWKRPAPSEAIVKERPDSSTATPTSRPARRPVSEPVGTEPLVTEVPQPTPPPEQAQEVDLSVELPAAERAKLAEEARIQLAEAQRVVSSTAESSLTRETLVTIRELIGSANHALNAGDMRAAESLARKAYLLAVELRAP